MKVNLWSPQRVDQYVHTLTVKCGEEGGGEAADFEDMRGAAVSLICLVNVVIVHALQAVWWDGGTRAHKHTQTQWRCLRLNATAMRQDHRELSFIQSLIRGGTEGARAPPPFSGRAAATAADTLFKSLAAPKP